MPTIEPGTVVAGLLIIFGALLRWAMKYINTKGEESSNGVKAMAEVVIELQTQINDLKQENAEAQSKMRTLQEKEQQRDQLWAQVVENNTAALTRQAERDEQRIELHKKNVELQQENINQLKALQTSVTEWPKTATETTRMMTEELKRLRQEDEKLPQTIREIILPLIKDLELKMDTTLAKFKSEDALDSSTAIDPK